MCRNIKPLYHFEPPATEAEIQAASLQFVRKVTGSTKPSRANQAIVDEAVDDLAAIVTRLLARMTTHSPPKNRTAEVEKRRARAQARFGSVRKEKATQ